MHCPKCLSTAFYKHGFVTLKGQKEQRYCCKTCNCQFTKTTLMRLPINKKLEVLKLYKEGMGFRKIGRILEVSFHAVRCWIKETADNIKNNIKISSEYDIIEIDEMYSYIKKNPIQSGFGLLITEIQGKYLAFKLEVEKQ